jgi:uncharacterized membrane protein
VSEDDEGPIGPIIPPDAETLRRIEERVKEERKHYKRDALKDALLFALLLVGPYLALLIVVIYIAYFRAPIVFPQFSIPADITDTITALSIYAVLARIGNVILGRKDNKELLEEIRHLADEIRKDRESREKDANPSP